MHKKHGLLMLVCCLIPLGIVFVLPYLGFQVGGVGRFASIGIALICPLMHLGLLAYLFKGNRNSSCCTKEDANNQTL